jgi:hypothetical protein
MITIDTKSTLYVCTDGANAEVHILTPSSKTYIHVEQLRLDDPDPYGPHSDDPAMFKLLCETDMERVTFEI